MTGDSTLNFRTFRLIPRRDCGRRTFIVRKRPLAPRRKCRPPAPGTIAPSDGEDAFMRGKGHLGHGCNGAKRADTQVKNADWSSVLGTGWSPYRFTVGSVDARTRGEGGRHKVYDIFIAYVDSADKKNELVAPHSNDLGSRDPEWSVDGKPHLFVSPKHEREHRQREIELSDLHDGS